MLVKTILYAPDGTGFYVSSKEWNNPNASYNLKNLICNHPYGTGCNCRSLRSGADWRWIGYSSWHGSYAFFQIEKIREFMQRYCEGYWSEGDFEVLDEPYSFDIEPANNDERNYMVVFCGFRNPHRKNRRQFNYSFKDEYMSERYGYLGIKEEPVTYNMKGTFHGYHKANG